MKKRVFFIVLMLFAGIIVINSRAEACHFENVAAFEANCNGFSISGDVVADWRYIPYVNVTYSFVIINGTQSIPVSGTIQVSSTANAYTGQTFQISDIWTNQFCGDVYIEEVKLDLINPWDPSVILSDTILLYSVSFDCPCISWCPRTPGYWKNHPESWPVSTLEVGGVLYTKEQLIAMLETPLKSNKNLILIKHLIASKLNILSGSILTNDVTDEADTYLASGMYDEEYKNYLKDVLDAFNNSGNCD